jgi:hypothetical protein
MTPPTGFDRLRESGFTEEDIGNIRTQFHRLHGTSFEGTNTEETRTLEEQWMENTNDTLPDGSKLYDDKAVIVYNTPLSIALQGTYGEMFLGLTLGFFMGILCLFWFRESIFSRRHQMGIVAGILINVSFGILHVYY